MSNISPRTPPGFGSSSSRFQKKRSDKAPGPGAYTPNHASTEPKVEGGTFSKAARFQDDAVRSQVLARGHNPLDSVHVKLKSGY